MSASPRRYQSNDNVETVSPRPHKHIFLPRLGSFADSESSTRPNVVVGFSPPPSAGLPTVKEGVKTTNAFATSPRSRGLHLQSTTHQVARLSPQITTPVEQTFHFTGTNVGESPRPVASSPRANAHADLAPRSRRNSGAIVSISLSSRSRSRTPRGGHTALPATGSSGHATPNKGSNTPTPRPDGTPAKVPSHRQLSEYAAAEDLDDWQPTGGMLLDDGVETETGGRDDESAIEDDLEDDGRQWTFDDLGDERAVEDILSPGMLFGEGKEFQGELIRPAVRPVTGDEGEEGFPLRRGGSEMGKATRGDVNSAPTSKKVYEVVRQLGSGSYAVVYLVREKGGRRREYALKCLSKQDLEPEQIETQLFEATIHLSLPIHQNIVTLHQTFQTKRWLFLMLELCPGEDLFFWLEKSRDASPPVVNSCLPDETSGPMSSSKFSSSSIPFSSSQMFPNINSHFSSSFSNSPSTLFANSHGSGSPASLLFAHHNGHANGHSSHNSIASQTPPTPSLLSAFAANTLLSPRRLKLIASMFSQMCEAVAVCHDAGVSHRDIKPENFICCDSIELENTVNPEGDDDMDFGPQAKRKVVVKLTDFGLATAEAESGDVECGSKPYMSYECRNNLGPTYQPGPADVWSLGIVLINMLFHRNPWKDPTPGDPNFDKFLRDPTGFLLAKFTGIGREVASYLADHVLCTEVEDRVTARDFGQWIRGLTEMIAGRKAVNQLKMAKLETKNDRSSVLFVKSPVGPMADKARKHSTSALTSSAPPQAIIAPSLSSLPPPSQLAHDPALRTPELDKDVEGEVPNSASTVDEQITPSDPVDPTSPDTPVVEGEGNADGSISPPIADADARSLSTHKRRKRGVRKGKAAQAAAAAAQATSGGETKEARDALLSEFAAAAQSLARDLSSKPRPAEFDSAIEFPPLGTTPSQMAAAKKSKWKDLMKLSSGNPELEALARRVAERDAGSGGNWSAPAKMQQDANRFGMSMARPNLKQSYTQTATVSSGFSSGLSSFGPVSSATSSSGGGFEDEDWRKGRLKYTIQEDDETAVESGPIKSSVLPSVTDKIPIPNATNGGNTIRPHNSSIVTGEEESLRGRGQHRRKPRGNGREEDVNRARQAALAAAAITGGMDAMGSFGAGAHGTHRIAPPGGYNVGTSMPIKSHTGGTKQVHQHGHVDVKGIPHGGKTVSDSNDLSTKHLDGMVSEGEGAKRPGMVDVHSSESTITASQSHSSSLDNHAGAAIEGGGVGVGVGGPNKPKLKGQIQSLAKMLSGLKTKGKD